MPSNPPQPVDAPLDDTFESRIVRAVVLLSDVTAALGPGRHTITCSATRTGQALTVSMGLQVVENGISNPELAVPLVTVLTEGFQPGCAIGLVVRSHRQEGGRDVLRGWVINGSRLRPLAAEQIQRAYSTDLLTGETLPTDPDTVFRPGIPLPPRDSQGREDDDDGTALHDG